MNFSGINKIDGSTVLFVSKFKSFWVIYDSRANGESHVEKIEKKVNRILYVLRFNRNFQIK